MSLSFAPRSRLFERLWLIELLMLPWLLLIQGCGFFVRSGETGPQTPPPGSPPPTAGQNGTVTITPMYLALAPGQKFKFSAAATNGGQIQWLVNGTAGGSAAMGTVDAAGNYTAPASISQSQNITVTAALAAAPQQNFATAAVSILLPGTVLCPLFTGNPQVAQYSIYLPAPGKVSVQFGKSTNYGLNTWQVATPTANGGQAQTYVAGMLGDTKYHIRGQVTLDNGATLNDTDQTCTTGTPPATTPITISTPSGPPPQPGIEMWNTIQPQNITQAFATDLDGNVIWTYSYQGTSVDLLQGIQLLPNGHFLMVISYLSSLTVNGIPGLINEVREVDLVGNTIRSITMDQLNQKLATSNLRDADGNSYQLRSFHHSVLALPNGHWLLLAAYTKDVNNLARRPGTTKVIGDALVDVDPNFNPVWVWNTFDHLDINRQPMNFPDWTHSNDMLYSSDDHNLLLSIRHQNWVIKIDYLDGQGSGKILWRLGEGGDFKLVGGTDPTDWFYAQHGLSFFTQNTTGVYRLGLMDNGNDRIFPTGQVMCAPSATSTPTCYSTVPLFELNENNMTATLVTHYVPPASYYSFFGGNTDQLSNGNFHVNFCGTGSGAIVQELDPTASHVIWQGTTANADQYHVNRLPSLYPGVRW
jgi:arylsulfate sulfotransferase